MIFIILKPLLKYIINTKWTRFVEGRQFLEGIVIAHEIVNFLKKNKKLGILVKLDLSKGYDYLIWSFLTKTLEVFSFSTTRIRWIKSLVSCPFSSTFVSGSPMKSFRSSRGLLQGNPISPFFNHSGWRNGKVDQICGSIWKAKRPRNPRSRSSNDASIICGRHYALWWDDIARDTSPRLHIIIFLGGIKYVSQ